MLECEKIVRQTEFLRAIEQGDPPSAAEGLNLDVMGGVFLDDVAEFHPIMTNDGIVIEPDYDGARLEKDMTLEFIEDMIERFKNGKKIHKKYAYQIVLKAKEIFYAEPTMPEVTIVEGKTLTVCGDTHGISPPYCYLLDC